MEIISLPFAALAVTSVFVYYLLNPKLRVWYLTILSCGLIAGFSYVLFLYIIFYSIVNYYFGLRIPRSRNKRLFFRAGLIINLTQLIVLKYSSFILDPLFQLLKFDVRMSGISEVILPIGVSYFTLQGIGYLTNVKMGWEKPETQFPDFLLFITFFPKFLSGPIERSNHFFPQMKTFSTFSSKQVTEGLRIALFGFFKKVVIANQLGIIIGNTYYDLSAYGGLNLWIVILIQPLYLYFDFSGYTDIAIGIAKAFGIELLPNFNRPFFSENMTTFWKKFHISLSSWFNDYVFRPVSFRNKKWGVMASVYAVFLTWILFGIWHGAGWNFMILGLLQALVIIYEFFTKKIRVDIFSKMPGLLRVWMGRIFTYIYFGYALIFFFSPDIKTTFSFFGKITNLDINTSLGINKWSLIVSLAFMVLLLIIELFENDYKAIYYRFDKYWNNHKSMRVIVYYIAIFLIIFHLRGNSSFIYQMF